MCTSKSPVVAIVRLVVRYRILSVVSAIAILFGGRTAHAQTMYNCFGFIGPIQVSTCNLGSAISTDLNVVDSARFSVVSNTIGSPVLLYMKASCSANIIYCPIKAVLLSPLTPTPVAIPYALGGPSVPGGSYTLNIMLSTSSGFIPISQETGGQLIAHVSNQALAGTASGSYYNPALCVLGCFETDYRYTTTPFYTLDTPRSVTLVYRGDRANPRPMLPIDFITTPNTLAASKISLQASIAGSSLTFTSSGTTSLQFTGLSLNDTLNTLARITGQFDATSYATGEYSLVYTVAATYSIGSGTTTLIDTVPLIINNGTTSPVARGWDIAGIEHLWFTNGGYLVTDGDGSAVWYGTTLPSTAVDGTTLRYDGTYYYRSTPDSSVIRFSSSGQMQFSKDRLGRQTTITYDGSGRVTDITDPMRGLGHFVPYYHLTYGTYGLSSISEQGGSGASRVTTVTVDASGHLTQILDPDGYHTDFTYDAHNRMSTETDRRGTTIQYGYDSTSWKLTSQTVASIPVDNGSGGTTPQSLTTTYHPWQLQGLPPLGKGTTASPGSPMIELSKGIPVEDDSGSVTDPGGATTQFVTDSYGQILSVLDPLKNRTTIQHSGLLPTVITEPDSSVTTMAYSGTLLQSVTSGTSWTHYHYGAFGQVDSVVGSAVPVQRFFINGTTGNPDSIRTAATEGRSQTTRMTYDTLGRMISTTDAFGHVTYFHYDALFGNLDSALTAGNEWGKTIFDAYGRDSLVTTLGAASTKIIYDVLNRPISVYDGVNATPATMTYDPLLRTAVYNSKGELADSVAYNALGWIIARYDTHNTALAQTFRYDKTGNVTSTTNRRASRIDFQYDALGRLIRRTYGTSVDTFTFAPNGASSSASNGLSSISYGVGRNGVQATTIRLGTTTFVANQYASSDSLGVTDSSVVTMGGSPLRRWIFHHDSSTGDISAIDLGLSIVGHAKYTYNVLGQLIEGKYGSTPTQTVNSDSLYTALFQLIESSFNTTAATNAFRRAYAYDSLGRVAAAQAPGSIAGKTERTVFGYDGLGRLTSVDDGLQPCTVWPWDSGYPGAVPDSAFGFRYSCGSGTTTTYSYDAASNRTDNGGTYSAGNRILTFGAYAFTHDADGNVTRKSGGGIDVSYTWDELNRLRTITDNNTGHTVQFDYDPFDQIIRRTTNGVVDHYWLWEDGQIAAEFNGSFGLMNAYAYMGTDVPAIEAPNSGPRYPQLDARQNVIGTVDSTQAVVETASYDAWGTTTLTGDSVTTLRWKGLHWEPGPAAGIGLYYVRARWYDPSTGRFLSEDPAGVDAGINPYTFADDDPINGFDPSGAVARFADSVLSYNQMESPAQCTKLYNDGDTIPRDTMWSVVLFTWACPYMLPPPGIYIWDSDHGTLCRDASNLFIRGLLTNIYIKSKACSVPVLTLVNITVTPVTQNASSNLLYTSSSSFFLPPSGGGILRGGTANSGGVIVPKKATPKPPNTKCSVSASSLDTYLSTKKSPMVGQGTNLMTSGAQFNLDPRLFVALSGAETQFGTKITAGQYNAFNVLYHGLHSPYDSFQKAINAVGVSLTNPKNQYNLSNTATLYHRYCSTGNTCGAGLRNVNTFMREQGANIDALQYPCKKD